ncbi:hypothetical protein CLU79DRAFT_726058 [Phycomyces nitens]|nr:hypothetical protein CLU79DRAFT_726058 [Phycomyces nitens]
MEPPAHLTSRRQRKIWEQQQKDNAAKRHKPHHDPFRTLERHFKAPNPSMEDVIDLHAPHDRLVPVSLAHPLTSNVFGTAQAPQIAYVVKGIPGLIVIPNPFSPEAQRSMIAQCLREFARPPNTSNHDTFYKVPETGLWPLYVAEQSGLKPLATVPVKEGQSASLGGLSPAEMVRKQRWVTLGYQYHWGTKEYDLERDIKVPLPVGEMALDVVTAIQGIGGEGWTNTYQASHFKAEAGVINYYQIKDTLMAHVDKSELNMEAPLVSASFGLSCIYLVGGPTKDTTPVALRLSSGDVLVMTGDSRKAYHGVPRILEGTLPAYLGPEHFGDLPDGELLGKWMNSTRINLNVRKVFPTRPQDPLNVSLAPSR